jgi:hypothetical protein
MSNIEMQQNRLIKKEADSLLYQQGLYSLLNDFGKVHVSGSYYLDLMVWRDLDIYLEVEAPSIESFFVLGSKLCQRLQPTKMHFRNELLAKTAGLPNGLYWGTYLGNEKQSSWKIDLWAVDPTECNRLLGYCEKIKERLSPECSTTIMKIKSQCWNDPGYRRNFTSTDIYTAVIDNGIKDMNGFKVYLENVRPYR